MDWDDLPLAERQRILVGSRELAMLAWRYSCSVLFADPTYGVRSANTASGFVLKLDAKCYFVTAHHILEEYEIKRQTGRTLIFQVGNLPLNPVSRLVWGNESRDLAVFDLSGLDLTKTGSVPYAPIGEWPPPVPSPGEYIQFSGFPKAFRQYEDDTTIVFEPLPGFVEVKTAGEHHFTAQLERQEFINFGHGEVPPADGFRAMSGGPVLQFGRLAYPLVGLVSQSFEGSIIQGLEILRFASLSGMPKDLGAA
jgi:hypothetical protein